jgi:tellurite methyltransferase
MLSPSPLMLEYLHLFTDDILPGPVLDLACGECHNGILLAQKDLEVVCADRAAERLDEARRIAGKHGARITTWEIDLEIPGEKPLQKDSYGAILIFRYLHRPLIPLIKEGVRQGGLLLYETYTAAQSRFGKPYNPDHVLQEGELLKWFEDWEVIHYFEGIMEEPMRAMAQIVCRKWRTE